MMDRRLKERLVGATILVALIVIIVPELLSGPKQPALPPLAAGLPATPTRSVLVDLGTNKTTAEPESASQPPPAQAPTPAAPASAPSAAAPSAEEPPPASTPSVTTLRAQSVPQAPLETPSAPPKSASTATRTIPPPETQAPAHHAWAVQLGSFASKANAERLMRRLQASGGTFYVVSGGSGAALRYRVRMGPLADRAAAEHALAKLKAQGHSATIVTPSS
jgi:DedD protein